MLRSVGRAALQACCSANAAVECAAAECSSSSSSSCNGMATAMCSITSGRCFSSYASPRPPGSLSGARRVYREPPSNGQPDAASTSGASDTTKPPLGFLEMGKEVPGGSKKMMSWERWYWGVGVTGIAIWLFSRMQRNKEVEPPEAIEDKRRQAEELEAKRKQHFRTMLMADKSFMEGEDDPFDGMSPQQIQEFIESSGIDVKDPFEGMTPEEIDAYMAAQLVTQSEID